MSTAQATHTVTLERRTDIDLESYRCVAREGASEGPRRSSADALAPDSGQQVIDLLENHARQSRAS